MRSRESVCMVAMMLAGAAPAWAQIPSGLSGRLVFSLAGTPAGQETYRIERVGEGYRLQGDVDLQVAGMHIVQHLEVEAGPRLAVRAATVGAVVNGDSTTVRLTREGDFGVQEFVRGETTTSTRTETPPGSVLLTNNVIHHLAQFAWLHDGGIGESRDVVAFPRVPVGVELRRQERVTLEGEALDVRLYRINLASRLAVFVWLAPDGRPLKISVPMQAFEAVDEAYTSASDVLSLADPRTAESASEPSSPTYEAREVRFESDGVTLAGTLTLPRGSGPWPAAVLISGSGGQDRDENTPGQGGLKLGIFRSIADTLTGRGIAVLRYDDRGVGGSGGDLRTAGLVDLVGDVGGAVDYLRGLAEIDGERVALVGHSEGGVIAPIVAADDPEIAAVVLMAGTATSLDSVLMDQIVASTVAAGGDSGAVAQARAAVTQLASAVREGRDPAQTDLPPALKALGANAVWLRQHMEHDPLATIRRVRAPVLVVSGAQDIQVPPEHARRLGAALAEAGHPDYEVEIFPRLNHLFAESRGDGAAEYSDPDAHVDEAFLGFLADWLARRLGA